MIDDREIWACANLLMKQHGDVAWYVVSERADALLAAGETEGYQIYRRILDRICQLEGLQPEGQVH